MYTPSKEELEHLKRDAKMALHGYRLRKHQQRQKKLNTRSTRAVQIVAALALPVLTTASFA